MDGAYQSFTTSDTGLMGWWRFDGDAKDSSGNTLHGLDGTPNGTPLLFKSGVDIDGSALDLTAGNDYVRVPHNNLLNNPRTIEIRLKANDIIGGGLIDKLEGSNGYFLRLLGGNIDFVTNGMEIVENANAGSWQHVAIALRDGFQGLYYNGRLVDYREATLQMGTNNRDLIFGEYFKGEIDECGSQMKMSGLNGKVIMSGYENHTPDHERETEGCRP